MLVGNRPRQGQPLLLPAREVGADADHVGIRHDDVAREAWLHGVFDYALYR